MHLPFLAHFSKTLVGSISSRKVERLESLLEQYTSQEVEQPKSKQQQNENSGFRANPNAQREPELDIKKEQEQREEERRVLLKIEEQRKRLQDAYDQTMRDLRSTQHLQTKEEGISR